MKLLRSTGFWAAFASLWLGTAPPAAADRAACLAGASAPHDVAVEGEGVRLFEIGPEMAPACATAVEDAPQDAAVRHAYGRALYASGQLGSGVEAMCVASASGHAAAMVELVEIHSRRVITVGMALLLENAGPVIQLEVSAFMRGDPEAALRILRTPMDDLKPAAAARVTDYFGADHPHAVFAAHRLDGSDVSDARMDRELDEAAEALKAYMARPERDPDVLWRYGGPLSLFGLPILADDVRSIRRAAIDEALDQEHARALADAAIYCPSRGDPFCDSLSDAAFDRLIGEFARSPIAVEYNFFFNCDGGEPMWSKFDRHKEVACATASAMDAEEVAKERAVYADLGQCLPPELATAR